MESREHDKHATTSITRARKRAMRAIYETLKKLLSKFTFRCKLAYTWSFFVKSGPEYFAFFKSYIYMDKCECLIKTEQHILQQLSLRNAQIFKGFQFNA